MIDLRRPEEVGASGRRLAGARPGVVVLLLGCFTSGCGPSFEAIAEGDLRFAHCDRLDLDTEIAASHRLHCWREWRRVYTYGQTRDRVDYAQRRIAEVASGDVDPSFDLPSGEPEPSIPSNSVQPASPSTDGRPGEPPVAEPAKGAAFSQPIPAPGTAPLPALEVPGVAPSCRSLCQTQHEACLPGCETRPTGCQPCEPSLQACLQACGTEP